MCGFSLGGAARGQYRGRGIPGDFWDVRDDLVDESGGDAFWCLAALYLREYAKQGLIVRTVRIAVNNLAGSPRSSLGFLAWAFSSIWLVARLISSSSRRRSRLRRLALEGIMWAALTLALMTVPVVIVATEEALAAVPRGTREGSLACGASKWQTIQRVVLPAAAPGILTGLILAMARGAGEVAPLMLVGVVKLAPTLPVDGLFPFVHLDRKFMHLGFHIYDLGFQSPDSDAAHPWYSRPRSYSSCSLSS